MSNCNMKNETMRNDDNPRNDAHALLLFAILAVAAVFNLGYIAYGKYKAMSQADKLVFDNIEALSDGESSYEYPDGYGYSTTCNVSISKWKRCKVEVITCQGGGNGCNPRNCPTHN